MESGGGGVAAAAASAPAAHVFGACDLCGQECDQSIASLVRVECNQKACPDRRAAAGVRGGFCWRHGVFGARAS